MSAVHPTQHVPAAVVPGRAARFGLPTLAVILVGAWTAYLHAALPEVSRGDFLLAIIRQSAAVRSGDWLYALSWPVQILGGHIVFYERVLQLFNYYVLDYSPAFVKYCALAIWVLAGAGLYRLVARSGLSGPLELVLLVGLALVTFNPIPWEVLAWPDSNIPYLSVLVVLLFSSDTFVRRLNGPLAAADLLLLALLCVLMIVGSGVGWAILPTLGWLLLLRALANRDLRHLPLVLGGGAAALVLAGVLVSLFPDTLRLRLVADSLANFSFGGVGAYFLSLQATLFGYARRLSAWVGGLVFLLGVVVYVLHKRRYPQVTVPELLFVFGAFSLMLVSLGRWRWALELKGASTYYHLFALPLFYGLLLMLARVLPARSAHWVMGGFFLFTAAAIATKVNFFDRNLRQQGEIYSGMLPAVQGWRMSDTIRLIGEPVINEQILFEFLPDLKAAGKYRSLTADFKPYRSARMAPPRATPNGQTCDPAYRNLHLLETAADRRWSFTTSGTGRPFQRFVGVARNPSACADVRVAVSLVAADGTVQCMSWTTPNVHWYYPAPEHAGATRSPHGFDFSCPVEGGGPYFLVSSTASGDRVLEAVPLGSLGVGGQPHPAGTIAAEPEQQGTK